MDSYRSFVMNWFEKVWNQGDVSTLDCFMTDQTVFHGSDGVDLVGFEAFRASQDRMRQFFSHFRCLVLNTTVEAAVLCSTVRIKAKHRATGKRVQFQAMNRVLFDSSGKIQEAWDTIDWMSCLIQLNVIPPDFLTRCLQRSAP